MIWTIQVNYPIPGDSDRLEDQFESTTMREAHRELCRRLSVGEPRALTARDAEGRKVHASLYDGGDYLQDRRGRVRRNW